MRWAGAWLPGSDWRAAPDLPPLDPWPGDGGMMVPAVMRFVRGISRNRDFNCLVHCVWASASGFVRGISRNRDFNFVENAKFLHDYQFVRGISRNRDFNCPVVERRIVNIPVPGRAHSLSGFQLVNKRCRGFGNTDSTRSIPRLRDDNNRSKLAGAVTRAGRRRRWRISSGRGE